MVLLLLTLGSLTVGQNIPDPQVPLVEGFMGEYGKCTADDIMDGVSGKSLPQCADACRTMWLCVAFVYRPNPATCWYKFQTCAGKINKEIDAPHYTYVNPNPIMKYPGNDSLCEHHKAECVSRQCCPYEYEAEDICTGYPARVCCLHPSDCQWRDKVKDLSSWLEGSYGLPRSVYGCPETPDVIWTETRAWMTSLQDEELNIEREEMDKLPGGVGEAVLASCVMADQTTPADTRVRQRWPAGSYCLYRQAGPCPRGFQEGYVDVSGSNQRMSISSQELSFIEIMSNSSYSMGLCCRQDRHHILTAKLPTPLPFSMIKFGEECQNVLYMDATSDVIRLGVGPGGSVQVRGLVPSTIQERSGYVSLHFCHYKAYETCYQKEDHGRSYHGYMNMSQSGSCMDFAEYADWWNWTLDEPTIYNQVIENRCAGVRSLSDRPFCVAGKYREYSPCAIPSCPDFTQFAGVQAMGLGYPTRQIQGAVTSSYLSLDRTILTCSIQRMRRAWWQINLLQAQVVVGLKTQDRSGGDGLYTNMEIFVDSGPEDFLYRKGKACIANFWGYGITLMLQCLQELEGQYVTIRQGVWSEPVPSTILDIDGIQTELNLCEAVVYTKPTSCGQNMGHADLDPVSQVTTSSSHDRQTRHDVILHMPSSWCAASTDSAPFLMVDLLYTRQISGIWTQGNPDTSRVAMVTTFSVHYGYDTDFLVPFLEAGLPKIFNAGSDPHTPVYHGLTPTLRTRLIKVTMVTWKGRACFRFKLMGCLTTKENLVRNIAVPADQGQIMMDNTRSTCGALPADGTLSIQLSNDVTVRDIIIRVKGVTTVNATILVGVRDPPRSPLTSPFLCDVINSVSSAIVTARCKNDVRGDMVLVLMTSQVQVCEVEVYGTTDVSQQESNGRTTVSCGKGEEVEPVSVSAQASSQSGQVQMSGEMFWQLGTWCSSRSSRCTMSPMFTAPASGNGATQQLYTTFGCSQLIKAEETSCDVELRQEGLLSLTNQYLRMYTTIRKCSWTLTAPPGKFISITVSKLNLAVPETSFMDGLYYTNIGGCRDHLEVQYGSSAPEPSMTASEDQVFISPEGTAVVTLFTCYKHVYVEPDDAIQAELDIEFIECPGCKAYDTCTGVSSCVGGEQSSSCGFLQSPSFPLKYAANQKCSWHIQVKKTAYIQLEFVRFDVFEETSEKCEKDAVDVSVFDRTGEVMERLGRYCNTYRPPNLLQSGWNTMQIDFFTDGEEAGQGFQAKYREKDYDISASPDLDPAQTGCMQGWYQFNSTCFTLVADSNPVTWFQAERSCKNMSVSLAASLASIHSEQEMTFINYLLISVYDTAEAYIGLTDREEEGVFTWADNSPITYSNWVEDEPNGGAIEDCSQITLGGVGEAPSWKDVPCAATTISQYICSYSDKPDEETVSILLDGLGVCEADNKLFTCSTGECIQAVLVCDGNKDCPTGTDETMCGSGCEGNQFTCADGACVSLTFVCDGRAQCVDGTDELNCELPGCRRDEYTCTSGECVPAAAKCDQLKNCFDGSDEENCETCSERMFQCFDGTCIPSERLCDSYADCPGRLAEDESTTVCQDTRPKSCLEWRLAGFEDNKRYDIQYGSDEASVTCDMTSYPGYVVTKIHHNNEANDISVQGFENPASYQRNLTYFATDAIIDHIKSVSPQCEMEMEIMCFNAEAFAKSWWVGYDYNKYWYHEDIENDGCNCHLRKVCDERPDDTKCYCSRPEAGVRHVDSGKFTVKERLPIRRLTLEDTGGSHEQILYTIGSFNCFHAFTPGTARLRCKSGQSYAVSERCLYREDSYGIPLGCRDVSHLDNCREFGCPATYFKCPGSYCVSAAVVCDGTSDCPQGQDEQHCEELSCPGMLKCRESTTCIPTSKLCNGETDCLHGDDEWFCDVTCPEGCSCLGLTFNCSGASLVAPPSGIPERLRSLDVSDNGVDVMLWNTSLHRVPYLATLVLTSNGIEATPKAFFASLPNLRILDLSQNKIMILYSGMFTGLKNLGILSLRGNPISQIESGAFLGLSNLPSLNLSHMALTNISTGALHGLRNLQVLDISSNYISLLEQGLFLQLDNIKRIKMDQNSITYFHKPDFESLEGLLGFMHSDDFMFCCFVELFEGNCLPKRDLLSSCEDLMENNILRSFLWILGLMAFIGNSFVFVYRTTASDSERVPSVLIRNLSLADLLMGLYMLAIAGVDAFYRGVYIENARSWKDSIPCQILGCLSTVASEASVLTLGAITVDRLVNILFPLSTTKLNKKSVRYVICALWVSVVIIAVIPLIPGSYFQGTYYSRSGVCVSLYITPEKTPGWEYSFAIFHGLNLAVFLFIFVAYAYMYRIIRSSSALGAGEQKKREMAAARKMTLIVVTDFCCWVPINIMGFMALNGMDIPGSIYAWTVVFILPVNSALNPILYTISSIRLPWQKGQGREEQSTRLTWQTERTSMVISQQETANSPTLEQWMRSTRAEDATAVTSILHQVAALIKNLHSDGLYLGQLEPRSVLMAGEEQDGGETVSLTGCPLPQEWNAQGQYYDIELYGKLVSRLLRSLTMAKKK